MSNTLEVKSTFYFSDQLSEMQSLPIKSPSFLKQKTNNKKEVSSENLYSKNKLAVATSMVQTIRSGMDNEMKSIVEPYVTKKLASVLRSSFEDVDVLNISSHALKLHGFELGCFKQVCNDLRSRCFIRKGTHKGDVIFDLPSLIPFKELNAPNNATNFKICSKLVSISHFKKISNEDGYLQLSHEMNGLVGGYETSMLPLTKIQTQPITARLYINDLKASHKDVDTVLITAIKYYKYSEGKFEHLSKAGCMSISHIF